MGTLSYSQVDNGDVIRLKYIGIILYTQQVHEKKYGHLFSGNQEVVQKDTVSDAPVEEIVTVEATVEDIPVVEAPIEEIQVEEAQVVETQIEQSQVEQSPVIEETPV